MQIYGRIWFKLSKPKPSLDPPPPLRERLSAWAEPAPKRQHLIGPRLFRCLNQEKELHFPTGWNDLRSDKLWLYNLHYFDDLSAPATHVQWNHDLIRHWIDDNPVAKGVGWEPYPLSLRIVNWIKWSLAGNTLSDEMLFSLALQARFLTRKMEHHLLGNHLLANAKALIFAGLFFQGQEAEHWLKLGRRHLAQEVPEQILDDGGHFERSPMYHAIVLEDLLDLLNVMRTYSHERLFVWHHQLDRMRRWLVTMCHTDGDIALLNDAALGIAPHPQELEAYTTRLGLPLMDGGPTGMHSLTESGYVRVEIGNVLAILDVAPLGPDYLPAHGHADTLTFELSWSGRRLIVDSGTSCYSETEERLRQRGTPAHNTVVIDGRNSSDVYKSFRVGRRAHVQKVSVLPSDRDFVVRGSHDGYRHLKGVGDHTRTWRFDADELVITDEIQGQGEHEVQVLFHFHPDVKLTREGSHKIRINLKDGVTPIVLAMDPSVAVEHQESTYHPEFGLAIPNSKVCGRWSGTLPVRLSHVLRWSPARA